MFIFKYIIGIFIWYIVSLMFVSMLTDPKCYDVQIWLLVGELCCVIFVITTTQHLLLRATHNMTCSHIRGLSWIVCCSGHAHKSAPRLHQAQLRPLHAHSASLTNRVLLICIRADNYEVNRSLWRKLIIRRSAGHYDVNRLFMTSVGHYDVI